MKSALRFVVLLFLGLLGSSYSFCQTKKSGTKSGTGAPVARKNMPASKGPAAAELAAGKQLIEKSDCVGCHKADVKVVGPSYKEVAKKYAATEANYNLLAGKLIKGGSGSWGAIPMSAHPQLSPADAKKMVKYILAQREK